MVGTYFNLQVVHGFGTKLWLYEYERVVTHLHLRVIGSRDMANAAAAVGARAGEGRKVLI